MMKTSDNVVIVREDVCRDVVNEMDAFVAVEGVFAAMAAGHAVNFPVVREAIGHADALYGFKSGFDRAGMALGRKIWPMRALATTNQACFCLTLIPDACKQLSVAII